MWSSGSFATVPENGYGRKIDRSVYVDCASWVSGQKRMNQIAANKLLQIGRAL